MTRYDRRTLGLAAALSGLAGFVDAVGYLSSGNFFVSFMSGNTTRMAIGVAKGNLSYAGLALGAIGLFVTGVVLGSLLAERAGVKRKTWVLLLVAGLLAASAAVHGFGAHLAGTGLVLMAMGAENTTFQRGGEVSIGLTYMTGTLVKMGQRMAQALVGGPNFDWAPYAMLWSSLSLGATAGAAVHGAVGVRGLWIAAGAAALLSALAMRVRQQSGAETTSR